LGETIWKRDEKSVEIVKKGRNVKRKKKKAKRKVEIKMVKYIHQEDFKNIAGKGEYRENIYWHIAVLLEEEPGEESKMYGFKTKI
jgi:hypothetical protein